MRLRNGRTWKFKDFDDINCNYLVDYKGCPYRTPLRRSGLKRGPFPVVPGSVRMISTGRDGAGK